MRILFVINRYSDSNMSGAHLIKSLANFAIRNGDTVSILSSNENLSMKYQTKIENDIEIHQVKTSRFRSNSKILRFIREFLQKKDFFLNIQHSISD